MAKMKCLLLYHDKLSMFEAAGATAVGEAVIAMMKYASDGDIQEMNGIAKIVFESMRADFERDKAKYDATVKKRSEAGKRGMEKRWATKEDEPIETPKPKKEQPKSDSPTMYEVPLNDGTAYPVTADDVQELKELYPCADVDLQLKRMISWCNDNKSRRKTKNGVTRFIKNWLSKAHDEGSRRPQQNQSQPKEEFDYGEDENPFEAYFEWRKRNK